MEDKKVLIEEREDEEGFVCNGECDECEYLVHVRTYYTTLTPGNSIGTNVRVEVYQCELTGETYEYWS